MKLITPNINIHGGVGYSAQNSWIMLGVIPVGKLIMARPGYQIQGLL